MNHSSIISSYTPEFLMRFPGPYRQYWKISNINNELCPNCSFLNYLVVMMPPVPPQFGIVRILINLRSEKCESPDFDMQKSILIIFFYFQPPGGKSLISFIMARLVLLGADHHWLPSYYVFALFYWLMVFSWELRGYCHSFG